MSNNSIRNFTEDYTQLNEIINDVIVTYNGATAEYEDEADYIKAPVKAVRIS